MLLRYPGGKSRGNLSKLIIGEIVSRYNGGVFGEVFFGGAGITIQILRRQLVKTILINELDPALSQLWNDVIHNPGQLKKRVRLLKPSVDKFLEFKAALLSGDEDGFKFLFVNRASHAGRGVMAGPQGGINQNGIYKIDCRWKKESLCKTIDMLHSLFSSVHIVGNKCQKKDFESVIELADFYYLDPPYWDIGLGLYKFSFSYEDHIRLFNSIRQKTNWVLSYNNHPDVNRLYKNFRRCKLNTSGNGGSKLNSELLILPD